MGAPHDHAHFKSRVISVVAATGIALACGTNYAYSAWAPQFAERMRLSATEANVIGSAGNIGMYASGVPFGFLIDTKGPRWSVLIGAIALACGYFPLYSAYTNGPGSMSFSALCFFGFLTGMGSCSAFSGAIKVSATNWPQHRGTATAFPLSGFGLSAFAFTLIAHFAFPDNTAHYLLMLAIGTFAMVFTGMIFLRMTPPSSSQYQPIAGDDGARPPFARKNSNPLQRTSSRHSRHSSKHGAQGEVGTADAEIDETSSLISSCPGDIPDKHDPARDSHRPEITGWALLRSGAFWKLFILLGLLCGVGLMTINNIGNNAKTLWHHYDDTVSHDFIQGRQLMHVSILSVCSFVGRLLSGIGSDIIVKRLEGSRYWSIVASSLIFTLAQVAGLNIENPKQLFWLSGLTGLAYGALFGVYPALVADAFGAKGLGINWGAMTMSPVLSGNIFNVAYGRILDSHSGAVDGHERLCELGKACYSSAYVLTLCSALLGVAWSLWCVRHEWVEKKALLKRADEDHEG
ncbi:hypothetical protein MBLNU459_g5074t1 [Dothideomycetes sp. NU459]